MNNYTDYNMTTTLNSGYPGSGGVPEKRSGDRYPSPPNAGNVPAHHHSHHTHSVGFSRNSNKDDYQDERKKYLTAKYPQHQMRLIRKRLEVEDWVDKQLRQLYDVVDETDTYDCEIDLDELLDLDITSERRNFVLERITNVRKSQSVINRFVEELLEKAGTL